VTLGLPVAIHFRQRPEVMVAGATRRSARATRRLRVKVIRRGRGQSILLPEQMRIAATEVAIRREGNRLIIDPVPADRDAMGWPMPWWRLAGAAPDFDLGRRRVRGYRA